MTSRKSNRLSTLTAATLLALAFGGCATGSVGGRAHASDVRGKAAIASGGPHAIAEGPGRLLHVDVTGGRDLQLYSVMAREDGAVDCGAAHQVGAPTALHRDSNELNLELAPGQVVCVAAAGQTGRAEIAWHLQPALGPDVLIARR